MSAAGLPLLRSKRALSGSRPAGMTDISCPVCEKKKGSWLTLALHIRRDHGLGFIDATKLARGLELKA